MKVINKKENQITFSSEIGESLANAIRRYLNQIPVLAVDEVEISKNDSALYDEVIAHRIGLISLKMGKSIKKDAVFELKLDANKEGIVYSGELKGDVEIIYDKIPIVILNKGKELVLTAYAKLGKGSTHSKFSPGLMFYRNSMDIKIDKDCPADVVESCPQNILNIKDGKVVAENIERCDMCEACTDMCAKKGKDAIKLTPTKELILTLESFGQLDTKVMIPKAIDILKKDLEEVGKKLK